MTTHDERRLQDAILALGRAAAGAADKRYRDRFGDAAPLPGDKRFRKADKAAYDRFLAEEQEKRRPEEERLRRKLERLRGRGKPAEGVHCLKPGCNRSWPRDPALEVPCPECHVKVGQRCRRPSGHPLWKEPGGQPGVHADRDRAADAAGAYGPCPRGICGLANVERRRRKSKKKVARPPAPKRIAEAPAPCHQDPVDRDEFNRILDELGWKQADLARRLSEASGETVPPRTVNRWAKGTSRVHPGVAAYLRLALKVQRAQVQV